MRKLFLALLLLASPAFANFAIFQTSNGGAAVHGWQYLLIGGGGQITNDDYPTASASFLVTTDTAGVFGLNKSTNTWAEVLTSNSLPSAFWGDGKWLDGAYDIRSAPGDPTRCYLGYNVYNGGENTAHVLVSNNCNNADPTTITFTDLSGFTSACISSCVWSGAVSSYKFIGPKIGIDPNNKNVLIVATPHSGQFVSTDGTTFAALNNVTASAGGVPAVGIAFDTTSLHTCGAGSNQTCTVWICTQGAGCWRSTTGSTGTFTQQTSGTGPTNVGRAKIGIDGTFYATEYDGSKLWRFTTTWTDISPSSCNNSVVVSPFAAANVAAMCASGNLAFSTNANSGTPTWSGSNSADPTRLTADIPWLTAGPSALNYLNTSDAVMDPTTAGKIWTASGVGIWYTTSTTTPAAFTGLSAGIAQLVLNKLISPPGGTLVAASWDRPVFNLNPPNAYKTGYGPSYAVANNISMGWSVDWCTSAQTTIVELDTWGNDGISGYSTTNGVPNDPSSWTFYANFPTLVASGKIGGAIACSTPDNVVLSTSNDGDVYYSQNATSGSATWAAVPAATLGNGVRQSGVNNMTISAAASSGGGTTTTLTVSGIGDTAAGDQVSITGTAHVNGFHNILAVTGASITIDVAFAGSESAGSAASGVITGWGHAYYANRQAVCADRVTANTFYASNHQTSALGGGIYRISFPSGVLTTQQIISGPTDTGGLVTQLHCVPGNAGHLLYTQGQTGSGLWYTTGGSLTSTSFTQITGPTDVYQVTTGAIKSGNDYPSVYINAKVGSTGGPNNDGYSIWRSDNSKHDWSVNSVTWTDIGIPLGNIDDFTSMAGDNNTWGVLYAGGKGTGPGFYYTP